MSEKDPLVTADRHAVDAVRVMFGVGGLIAVIIGVILMLNPLQSAEFFSAVLAVILAVYLVVMGVVYLGTSLFARSISGWARTGNILLGLLYIIAAIILFANLGTASTVLMFMIVILIGIMWVVEGIISFTTVKASGSPALTIIYGIISVLAGAVLIFSYLLGVVVIVWMVGISLVVLGVVQIVRAFSVKPSLTA